MWFGDDQLADGRPQRLGRCTSGSVGGQEDLGGCVWNDKGSSFAKPRRPGQEG
jgi:hypothetical protein